MLHFNINQNSSCIKAERPPSIRIVVPLINRAYGETPDRRISAPYLVDRADPFDRMQVDRPPAFLLRGSGKGVEPGVVARRIDKSGCYPDRTDGRPPFDRQAAHQAGDRRFRSRYTGSIRGSEPNAWLEVIRRRTPSPLFSR